ncbi:MAG: hypothetical protein ACK42Z_08450, partial [Candidatus Kapaibacteriota bacterium]
MDIDNNVWVGGWLLTSQGFVKINNSDGNLLTTIKKYGGGGYGGFVNSSGFLVSSGHDGAVLVLNTRNPNSYFVDTNVKVYGVCPDIQEKMFWATGREKKAILKYEIDTVNKKCKLILEKNVLPSNGRGICLTKNNGDVWAVSSYPNGKEVIVYNSDTHKCDTVKLSNQGAQPTGIAVDYNGKIWVTNLSLDNVVVLDEKSKNIERVISLGQGAGPYTYSDMTGYVLSNFTIPFISVEDNVDFGTINCENLNFERFLEICNSGYRDLIIYSINKKTKYFTISFDSS